MLKGINLLTLGKQTDKQAMMLLMGEITEESCQEAIQWILGANSITDEEGEEDGGGRPEVLTLFICSEGGSLYPALALVDVMRGSSIPVQTIGLGLIASAGLLIFMAGQKGNRILTENTGIMSHAFSAGVAGNKHELLAAQKQFTQIDKRMIELYKKFTDLPEEVIHTKLLPPTDVWLTPAEAVELGMADHVKDLK